MEEGFKHVFHGSRKQLLENREYFVKYVSVQYKWIWDDLVKSKGNSDVFVCVWCIAGNSWVHKGLLAWTDF